MINNMHIKSEKYLRTHKIIQDDEEIPPSFLAGGKDSAKADPNFIFKAWFLVSGIYFIALVVIIFFKEVWNLSDVGWTLPDTDMLVFCALMLLSLILSVIVGKRMKSFQDNILVIPLGFESRINVRDKSRHFKFSAVRTISCIIMFYSFLGALCLVKTGYVLTIDLRPYFYLPLRFSYLFISILSAFPMCISYKSLIKIEEESHHFITDKKVYYTKNIYKLSYDSIEIADLKEVKATRKTESRGKSTNHYYFLRYISDKDQIFVEVLYSKFIEKEYLQELFPQTVITYIEEGN